MWPVRLQAAADFETILARHADIAEKKVGRLGGHGGEGRPPVLDRHNLASEAPSPLSQEFPQEQVILGDENAHRLIDALRSRRRSDLCSVIGWGPHGPRSLCCKYVHSGLVFLWGR